MHETELRAVSAPDPDSLPTRDSLLNRIKDLGDDASWREFFEVYWELIYNLATKAGLNESEAQEVVQETVITVSRRINSFKTGAEHGSFKAWLLQQARWRIIDQFRKRDRFSAQANVTDAWRGLPAGREDSTATALQNRIPDPATLDLDKAWEEEWEKHLLKMAIERVKSEVSASQFQMFDLHSLQGLSAKETAKTLGTSVIAVHMATSRLRKRLRGEIKRLSRSSPEAFSLGIREWQIRGSQH